MATTNKYIRQLEADLEIERERSAQLRKDVEYYRARVERLESHLELPVSEAPPFVSNVNAPAASTLVNARRMPGTRKSFQDLKAEWNSLSQEEQEKIVAAGEWKVGGE